MRSLGPARGPDLPLLAGRWVICGVRFVKKQLNLQIIILK